MNYFWQDVLDAWKFIAAVIGIILIIVVIVIVAERHDEREWQAYKSANHCVLVPVYNASKNMFRCDGDQFIITERN